MKLFKAKKRRGNWSVRFAWYPVKVEYNYKYYPQLKDQITATPNDDCSPYTSTKTEYWWVWLEKYKRFFNYGAPINYYISKNLSKDNSFELYALHGKAGIERIK